MTAILPYELYSDSPGFLLNKRELEAADAAHTSRDFGALPAGWPKRLEGPLVWEGKDLVEHPGKWIHILTDVEKREIDDAVKSTEREHFPLPTLGNVLRQIARNIYAGVGVQLLRGIPVEKYNREELVILCLGINSWSMTHIDPASRAKIFVSAQNADAQMFHSDAAADVVSLMAVAIPGAGGESKVASAWRVYNHLAEHRPDILRILGERKFRWRGKGIPDDGVRLVHRFQNQLLVNFSTRPFIGFADVPERDPDYPDLTFEEREAFAGFQWVADQYGLTTPLQNGDIEWVNNLVVQHARTGYVDDPNEPRHLLRVWLRDSGLSPELPADIRDKFNATFQEAADFIPLDEIEEDRARLRTAILTAACEGETAERRLRSERFGADKPLPSSISG